MINRIFSVYDCDIIHTRAVIQIMDELKNKEGLEDVYSPSPEFKTIYAAVDMIAKACAYTYLNDEHDSHNYPTKKDAIENAELTFGRSTAGVLSQRIQDTIDRIVNEHEPIKTKY